MSVVRDADSIAAVQGPAHRATVREPVQARSRESADRVLDATLRILAEHAVITRGWGERHPLAGRRALRLPDTYLPLHAPRDAIELAVVRRIVERDDAGPGGHAGGVTDKSARFDFTDSVVLVTGGGSGIGPAITRGFAAAGATVVITGRRREVVEQVAAETDGRVIAAVSDVSDGDSVRTLVEGIVASHGHLDVVVSNAAGYESGELTDLADADWAAMRATNVDGFFHLAKAALPRLAESGGNLVAVSSVSGLAGDWGQAGYNATKAAVTNFVRSLALDWGGRGVRLNAVAPAMTDTPITHGIIEAGGEPIAKAVDRVALGRVGQPEDIAPAVLFLASDAARYVTGAVLAVDGGTSASTGQAAP